MRQHLYLRMLALAGVILAGFVTILGSGGGGGGGGVAPTPPTLADVLSLIHISEPTRPY